MTRGLAMCSGRLSAWSSIGVRSGPATVLTHRARPRTDLPLKGEPMADKPTHDIRALPIYRDGFRAGQDTGLVYAMSAITSERVRQTLTAANRPEHERGPYQLADAALVAVSRVLAARFRALDLNGGHHA
jgi:hypothetical protein